MKKVVIINFKFIVGTKKRITEFIVKLILNKKSFVLLPTSLNDLASVDQNSNLAKSYKKVDICVTDGMPLVWYFKIKDLLSGGKLSIERVYGPTLMNDVLKYGDKNIKHFFYGSSEDTLQKLRLNIQKITPQISITNMVSPPFRQLTIKEEAKYISLIKKSNTSVLWVGLSSPKQVLLATRWKRFLPDVSILCVGAAFDFLAGKTRTAPKIMQKMSLEWLFRLLTDPKRLWKRYLIIIPKFLIRNVYLLFFN